MKVSTNWLKDFVTLAPPLENIADKLTMAGLEVKKIELSQDKKDTIFEIEITTNRPDWLSHIGVAREIAAVQNTGLKLPLADKTLNRPMPKGWNISLKEQEGCPYYTGVYMEGIQHNPTPDFMKERLASCGIRSISLIVDITNYVLLETGQPLHAFDADLLTGQEIQIRKARPDESFTAISGSILKLGTSDLVISDKDKAVALAGIMGGKDSEVNLRTRNIFLESAYFHPRWVRQSSRRHSTASESSYRFERRIDADGVDFARDRAIALIEKYAAPRFISAVIRSGRKPELAVTKVRLSSQEVEKRIGVKIKPSEISSSLIRLGLEVKQDNPDNWTVTVPSFRADLAESIDLVEEVARIYGFGEIADNMPVRPLSFAKSNPLTVTENKIREFLAGSGFYECVTFSLVSQAGLGEDDLKDSVKINNPLNKELVWMRPTILTSLLTVLQKNQAQGAEQIPVFEVAKIYRMNRGAVKEKAGQPEEEKVVAIAWTGKKSEKTWLDKDRVVEFYDLQGVVKSLMFALRCPDISFSEVSKSFLAQTPAQTISTGDSTLGFLGRVNSETAKVWDLEAPVFYAEISIEKLLKHLQPQKGFQELPRFPAVERDFSLVVSETTKSGLIEEEILKLGQGLVRKVELFDLFRGGRIPKGFKNLAYRVTYQSHERTLVSDEIQKLHTSIADAIVGKFQAAFQ